MSDEDNVMLDTPNEPTEEVEKTEVVEETPAEDGSEDLEKLRELNKKLFERTKKAEEQNKQLKAQFKTPTPAAGEKQPEVSLKDQYALLQAQVSADDIDEVIEYAKFKGITVTEALGSTVVKATLKEKAEQRKSAEVTNTSGSRRTTAKLTDDALLRNFEAGVGVDDSDDYINRLTEARINAKKKK